jgi:hypothetical protein
MTAPQAFFRAEREYSVSSAASRKFERREKNVRAVREGSVSEQREKNVRAKRKRLRGDEVRSEEEKKISRREGDCRPLSKRKGH